MSYANLKVSSRLGLGFGTLIVLLIAIAFVGLWRLSGVNASMDTVLNDRVPKVNQLEEAAFMAMDNARIMRNIILINDENVKTSDQATYDKNNASVDTILASFEKDKSDSGMNALVDDVKSKRAAYNAYSKEVIGLGLEHRADAATKVLYGENYKSQAAYFESIRKLVDFEKALVRETNVQSVDNYHSARSTILGLGGLACLLGVAIAYGITRSLIRELGGEPGTASALAHAVAQGDLSAHIETKANDTTSLMAQLKTMQDSLSRVVSRVRAGSDGVASASAQIAKGNNDLSSRTEQQASALQQTAASMEELSATVKLNAESAQQANQLAQSASTIAVQGGAVVAQVVDTMKGINDSSKKISDIINVIDGIAFQTNILALNAAVEAARAGEQGRGFAVVASEVRSLAGRSADAAKEIKKLIGDSVARVGQGSLLVDQAGATMTEVVSSIRRVTDIMGEISSASSEQASGVAQIGQAVTQMDQATQQNAALVEEIAAAAASLESQAQELVQAVAVFNLAQPRIGANTTSASAERMARASVAKPAARFNPPARKPAQRVARAASVPALAASANKDDWTSF